MSAMTASQKTRHSHSSQEFAPARFNTLDFQLKTMRIFVSALITLLLIACQTLSYKNEVSDQSIIAVLDFKAIGISKSEVDGFADTLSSYIVASEQYQVINRQQIDKILQEAGFSYADCYGDEECQTEAGILLSANIIIIGELSKYGNWYEVNLKIFDVETGKILSEGANEFSSKDEMLEYSKMIIGNLPGLRTQLKRVDLIGDWAFVAYWSKGQGQKFTLSFKTNGRLDYIKGSTVEASGNWKRIENEIYFDVNNYSFWQGKIDDDKMSGTAKNKVGLTNEWSAVRHE